MINDLSNNNLPIGVQRGHTRGPLAEQWLFRVNEPPLIDGIPSPSSSIAKAIAINRWEIIVPSWARAYRFDGCSAGAGGGPASMTVSGGGGSSGLVVLGAHHLCIPNELLIVQVGIGAAPGQAAAGPQNFTQVSGLLSECTLAFGRIDGAVFGSTPQAGSATQTGGGFEEVGASITTGGAVGTTTSAAPPGTVSSILPKSFAYPQQNTNAPQSNLFNAPRITNFVCIQDIAHSVEYVSTMAGWGGTPGGTGQTDYAFFSRNFRIQNTDAPPGLGGFCLPFVHWSRLPVPVYNGVVDVYSSWLAAWNDSAAGFGRGGIGARMNQPISSATPGGNGVGILTFLEQMP